MGWDGSHLHEFRIGQMRFGKSDPNDRRMGLDPIGNERTTHLYVVLRKVGTKATYTYDFGDSWEHAIVVERVLPPEPGVTYPFCVAGKLQDPPEDRGVVSGYYNLLEALRDPDHEEHADQLNWVGGEFNPDAFPVDEVNQKLAPLQRWWAKPQNAHDPRGTLRSCH
jgi:pRiA4b ORF-3-like protein